MNQKIPFPFFVLLIAFCFFGPLSKAHAQGGFQTGTSGLGGTDFSYESAVQDSASGIDGISVTDITDLGSGPLSGDISLGDPGSESGPTPALLDEPGDAAADLFNRVPGEAPTPTSSSRFNLVSIALILGLVVVLIGLIFAIKNKK